MKYPAFLFAKSDNPTLDTISEWRSLPSPTILRNQKHCLFFQASEIILPFSMSACSCQLTFLSETQHFQQRPKLATSNAYTFHNVNMTELGPGRLWQTIIHQLAGSADIQLWPGTLCENWPSVDIFSENKNQIF